jgi:bacterioferritin
MPLQRGMLACGIVIHHASGITRTIRFDKRRNRNRVALEKFMGQHDELIKVLNEAISLEYTAAVQYNQHSMLVTGRDKILFEDLFKESAKESLSHAKMWGDRIVYLGGTPTAELGPIRQSTDVNEMLQMDLEIEEKAVEIYSRAHRICKHQPTVFMLENHILDEDKDVEELMKLLRKVKIAEGAQPEQRAAAAS